MDQLPPLDGDCQHCTGPVGEAARAANRAAWEQWSADDERAYDAFRADRRRRGLPEWNDLTAYRGSAVYAELLAEQPEELPGKGCVECDWTGRQITGAGREVLAFLATHRPR